MFAKIAKYFLQLCFPLLSRKIRTHEKYEQSGTWKEPAHCRDCRKLRGISFLETALATSFSNKMLQINELKYEAVVFNEGRGHNYTTANVPAEAVVYFYTQLRERRVTLHGPHHGKKWIDCSIWHLYVEYLYETRKRVWKGYDWKRRVVTFLKIFHVLNIVIRERKIAYTKIN